MSLTKSGSTALWPFRFFNRFVHSSFCCEMCPRVTGTYGQLLLLWKLFNTNSLFVDTSFFNCFALSYPLMLWLSIFLSTSSFYHWSSRERIPARSDGREGGETMGWVLSSLTISGSFWLLAQSDFTKPKQKQNDAKLHPYVIFFSLSFLLTILLHDVPNLSVPIGNASGAVVCSGSTDFRLCFQATSFL